MEVLEVERVVPGFVERSTLDPAFADLELDGGSLGLTIRPVPRSRLIAAGVV